MVFVQNAYLIAEAKIIFPSKHIRSSYNNQYSSQSDSQHVVNRKKTEKFLFPCSIQMIKSRKKLRTTTLNQEVEIEEHKSLFKPTD
jgi:hypothetical protein